MAKRRKRTSTHKLRNSLLTLVVLIVAGLYFLITGNVPEEVQQVLPPQVREIFFPAPTETPTALELPSGQGNTSIESFNTSKRLLLKEVYSDHETTFYCGSRFDQNKDIYHDQSGYVPKNTWKRAFRLEWEHVVPAHAFGQSFTEWTQGHAECIDSKGKDFKGRKCAEKMNKTFRYMQADMYNLQPAIGEVNGLRSNYSYSMIEGEKRQFGSCNMEIEDRKAEPPDERFGDIARTYMYMESVYPGHGIISNKNEKLFAAWNKMDPVDQWECERTKRIEPLQGNPNHIVKTACQQAGLW